MDRQTSHSRIHRRPQRSRAFRRTGRHLVGSARRDARAAHDQSGAARLHPRCRLPRSSPATPSGSTAWPACASSTSAAAAVSCRSRSHASARRWSAPTRRRTTSRPRRLHAQRAGLDIDYRAVTAEALADAGERFDVVLAMEVVEHVADVALFVRRCAEMVKPGGLMIVATINRTLKSFALAIVGAEYILGWLPRGTHHWDKFVTPDELERALEQNGLTRDRRARRDPQRARRRAAAVGRHRRELHDGGRAARIGKKRTRRF